MMLILVGIFRHDFGIMRLKSRHHQRPEFSRFWHLWSLMMPTFGSHDVKMMPKRYKNHKMDENWMSIQNINSRFSSPQNSSIQIAVVCAPFNIWKSVQVGSCGSWLSLLLIAWLREQSTSFTTISNKKSIGKVPASLRCPCRGKRFSEAVKS